jgi:hypothetical protein
MTYDLFDAILSLSLLFFLVSFFFKALAESDFSSNEDDDDDDDDDDEIDDDDGQRDEYGRKRVAVIDCLLESSPSSPEDNIDGKLLELTHSNEL